MQMRPRDGGLDMQLADRSEAVAWAVASTERRQAYAAIDAAGVRAAPSAVVPSITCQHRHNARRGRILARGPWRRQRDRWRITWVPSRLALDSLELLVSGGEAALVAGDDGHPCSAAGAALALKVGPIVRVHLHVRQVLHVGQR